MNDSLENIGELIALKRYEQPQEGFCETFLEDFHRRQRADLLKRSSRSLFFERLRTWIGEGSGAKWAYGAGLAYATIMAGFFLWPHEASLQGPPAVPVSYEVTAPTPAPAQMEELDLRPAAKAEDPEKVF